MTTPRFLMEIDEHSFERLQELARLQRRSLKNQASLLLEAALEDRPDSRRHLEIVGAGRPGAA